MLKEKYQINFNDLKYKIKKLTNKTWKKVLMITITLIFLNTVIFFMTGKNIIENSIRAILYQAGIYTEEVKEVNIDSTDWWSQEEGSWRLKKSADWIEKNKAQITLDLTTNIKTNNKAKDVIFVIDISGSMNGDKIERVKKDTIELTDYILSDSENKVGLIVFDNTSEIISNLTNDKDTIINSIEDLNTRGTTNYSVALQNVKTLLESYIYNSTRDLVVLFLTDGYPNEDTPNQISEYKYLKERYPYILIEGIQYEMGTQIIKEIVEISDTQFIAYLENLNNVLFQASLLPESYESFEITDYIDNEYFHIESEDDIEVDIGKIKLETENGNQKVIWKFAENSFRTGSSAKMTINLVLNEKYNYNKGLYPTNTKEIIKSKLLNIDEETINSNKTPVLKNGYKITYDTNEPKGCRLKNISEENHYAFEVINKRTDELTCPGYIFKGWEVEENVTVINDDVFIMPSQNITIRGIWTSQNISKSTEGTIHEKATLWRKVKSDAESEKNGANTLLTTINDPYKVYYYNSSTNNHVYFAGSCWKIIRTTNTGGVKLLYNGTSLDGRTCESPNISLVPQTSFNSENNTLSSIGYMYNDGYYLLDQTITYEHIKITSNFSGTNYKYYSDSYRYENGLYYLENKDGSEVEEKNYKQDYKDLSRTFTCLGNKTSCTELVYVAKASSTFVFVFPIKNGASFEDENKTIHVGSSYRKNADGTYSLENISAIKKSEWPNVFEQYNNHYFCFDYENTTCKDLKLLSFTSEMNLTYEDIISPETGNLYGNSVTYDGINYHLTDTIKADNWSNFYNKITNNHYTCLNNTGICDKVYYMVYVTPQYRYYYEISDGNKIEDIIDEMLYSNNVNQKDSTAKQTLEKWYEDNLLDYTNSIEDTIYCNNRNIYNLNSLNPNGGPIKEYNVYFYDYKKSSLECPNKTDQFTVSKDIGNGKLKYPIGLMTFEEVELASPKVVGSIDTLLMTPNYYQFLYQVSNIGYSYKGNKSSRSVKSSSTALPVISLKNNIGYKSGDGSPENPYVIE